jgi:hypothetical protein
MNLVHFQEFDTRPLIAKGKAALAAKERYLALPNLTIALPRSQAAVGKYTRN